MRGRHPPPIAPPVKPPPATHHKPKATMRILSAVFLKSSLSAPSGFSNFPFCVIRLSGPFWAFLRFYGHSLPLCASSAAQALSARFWRVYCGTQHTGRSRRKSRFLRLQRKETAIREGGNPGPSRSFSAVSAMLSAIRSGKALSVSFCRQRSAQLPFCASWAFLLVCWKAGLSVPSRKPFLGKPYPVLHVLTGKFPRQ